MLQPATALVKLPDDISTETAATFLSTGLTAWAGLRAMHRMRSGDVVLVLGASGNVGSIVSRWARALGAVVIGVGGSPAKIARVEAGSTHALIAGDPDITSRIGAIAPKGVDIVIDLVGRATFGLAMHAVRDGGTIVTLGAQTGQPNPSGDLARRGVELVGGGMPQYVRGQNIASATSEFWDALQQGIFSDLPITRYAFDDVVWLHEDLSGRRLEGLPVLVV